MFLLKSTSNLFYVGSLKGMWDADLSRARRFETWQEAYLHRKMRAEYAGVSEEFIQIIEEEEFNGFIGHRDVTDSEFYKKSEL